MESNSSNVPGSIMSLEVVDGSAEIHDNEVVDELQENSGW